MKLSAASRQIICTLADHSVACFVEESLETMNWDSLIDLTKENLCDCSVRFFYCVNIFDEYKQLAQEILNEEREDFLNFCAKPTLEAVFCMGKLFPLSLSLWLRKHNKGILCFLFNRMMQIENGRYRNATPQELYDWFGHEQEEQVNGF